MAYPGPGVAVPEYYREAVRCGPWWLSGVRDDWVGEPDAGIPVTARITRR
jgi:hypothetical protein